MTRIGRVKVHSGTHMGRVWANSPDRPCFRTVVENGGLSLGCWRCIGHANGEWQDDPKLPHTIFERIS